MVLIQFYDPWDLSEFNAINQITGFEIVKGRTPRVEYDLQNRTINLYFDDHETNNDYSNVYVEFDFTDDSISNLLKGDLEGFDRLDETDEEILEKDPESRKVIHDYQGSCS